MKLMVLKLTELNIFLLLNLFVKHYAVYLVLDTFLLRTLNGKFHYCFNQSLVTKYKSADKYHQCNGCMDSEMSQRNI
jgi:hypothetical protein